ncbi:hypothetical protein C8J42_101919 [Sphingomonas sp. PP-CE-1A-559]|nr:hypothetical protein C8J42_101919 [Sphingomonas sp. PP-CE-1A-559]
MFTVHYNATISPDHVRLTNIATGQTVARAAPRPFSSQYRMIADPEAAALFLGNLIREVEGRKRWLRFFPTITVTISGEPRTKLDQEEVKHLFVNQGFVRVRVD